MQATDVSQIKVSISMIIQLYITSIETHNHKEDGICLDGNFQMMRVYSDGTMLALLRLFDVCYRGNGQCRINQCSRG